MHVPINPVTAEKLREFRRRRRRLVFLRGMSIVAATFAACLAVVVLLDWFVVLSDSVRRVLSGGAYLTTLVAAWFVWLRPSLRTANDRQIARQMEARQPELREHLLSAVELGETAPGPIRDSPRFRRLLQDDVAARVAPLRVERLLPWQDIRRWLFAASICLGVGCVLVLLPDLPFRTLIQRALVPGGNLGRVSHVQVRIVAPLPNDAVVPQNEPLPIAVELSEAVAVDVLVEVEDQAGGRQRVVLTRRGDTEYAGELAVADEPLRYRVLAGDAVTPFYNILPRPRPVVQRFEKNYRYPEYTGFPPRNVVDAEGHLEALEGSAVDLTIQCSVEVAEGDLRLSTREGESTVPLHAVGPATLAGTLVLRAGGSYVVHVVAADTRFANRSSSPYDIELTPDAAPVVEIVAPTDNAMLAPEAIVLVRGRARDDLGLAEVVQEIRVNERPAVQVSLPRATGQDVRIRQPWDLWPLAVNPGDRVVTRLVAKDGKGNIGESAAVLVQIVNSGFDASRLAGLDTRRRLMDRLSRLRADFESQNGDLTRAFHPPTFAATPADQREAHRLRVRQTVGELARDAHQLADEPLAILPQTAAGAESHELMLLGRWCAALEQYPLAQAARLLDRPEDADEPKRAALRAELLGSVRQGLDFATRSANEAEWFYVDESTQIAMDALLSLVAQQKRGTPVEQFAEDDGVARELILRRTRVAVLQTAMVERLLAASVERFRNRELPPILQKLAAGRTAMEKLLAEDATQPPTLEAVRQFETVISETLSSARPIAARLAQSAGEARRDYGRRVGHLRDRLKSLTPPLLTEQGPALLGLAKSCMSLEAARRDADWRYVADIGLAYRALGDLVDQIDQQQPLDQAKRSDVAARLARLAAAFQTLEAAHELAEIVRAERDLTQREKWASQSAQAHSLHPRQWDFVVGRLADVTTAVQSFGLEAGAMTLLQDIPKRPYFQEITARMASRRLADDPPLAQDEQLILLDTDLYAVLQRLLPQITASREALAQLAPTPIELLRRLAERTRRLQQATAELAATDKEEEPLDRPATRQRGELDKIRERIDEALAALRADAQLRDLFTAAGRTLARDVDDAALGLHHRAERADMALATAADTREPEPRRKEFADAAIRAGELAVGLDEVADHFERLDKGDDVAASREKLRAEEKRQGQEIAQEEREERLAELERQADLAESDPQRLLEELERELADNQVMQAELDSLTKQILRQARADLLNGARRQADLAARPAEAAAQQQAIREQVGRAAADVGRAGRHEKRLRHDLAADAIERIAADVRDIASNGLPALLTRLAGQSDPAALAPDLQTSAGEIARQADRIAALLGDYSETASDEVDSRAAQPTSTPADKSAEEKESEIKEALERKRNPETSKWLARALDELDETLNAEREKKHYEPLTATEAAKLDEQSPRDASQPMDAPQTQEDKPPMSDEQVEAKSSDDKEMPPASQGGESESDGDMGSGTSGTGPGGPPVPGLKPPKGKAKAAKPSFYQSLMMMSQAFDQEASSEADSDEINEDASEMLGPGGQAGAGGSRRGYRIPGGFDRRATGEWGQLPPEVARGLNEGSRRAVEGSYRVMVESYFRAIAEQSHAKDQEK